MRIVLFILVIIVILVAIWWWTGVVNNKIPEPQPYGSFQPLYTNFSEYPNDLWFGSIEDMDIALSRNRYRYRVIDSNGFIIYDNRSSDKAESKERSELFTTMEYIQATANGSGAILRDCYLNLAVRVVKGNLERVVHISTPNLI